MDYLEAHGLQNPADAAAVQNVINIFKRSLQGQSRLWIEGKNFANINELRTAFINRFSPSRSQFAHVKEFEGLAYKPGDSAETHINCIRQVAQKIGYGDVQIRDKFLSTIPPKCRAAVVMSAPDDANIDDLVNRAQRSLDLESEGQSYHKEVSFVTQAVNDSEMAELRQELNAVKLQLQDKQTRQHQSPNRSRARSPYQSRYKSSSCDNGKRSRSSSGNRARGQFKPRLICDYCLVPGHKWCQFRRRQEDLKNLKGNKPQYVNTQDF